MKTSIFTIVLLLVLSSCKKTVCSPSDFNSENIHEGVLYGAGDEGIGEENFVIKTQSEWDDLLNKVNSVNNESSDFTTTSIDFNEKMVIACFDPVRSSGGYAVSIASVIHDGSQITVDVVNSSPNGGAVTTVITQPYAIISVTKCDDPVVFE